MPQVLDRHPERLPVPSLGKQRMLSARIHRAKLPKLTHHDFIRSESYVSCATMGEVRDQHTEMLGRISEDAHYSPWHLSDAPAAVEEYIHLLRTTEAPDDVIERAQQVKIQREGVAEYEGKQRPSALRLDLLYQTSVRLKRKL